MGFDAEGYKRAWNAHDAAALVSHMTDDVVYEDVALGVRHEGRDEVLRFLERFEREFSSDYRFTFAGVETITDTGYALEWVVEGTHDSSGATRPATGRRFSIPGVSIGRLRGGRVTVNRDYWSLSTFLVQIGGGPAPEGGSAG